MNIAFYRNNALHDSWILLNSNFYLFEGLGKFSQKRVQSSSDRRYRRSARKQPLFPVT
jgi:hypothetical protein